MSFQYLAASLEVLKPHAMGLRLLLTGQECPASMPRIGKKLSFSAADPSSVKAKNVNGSGLEGPG